MMIRLTDYRRIAIASNLLKLLEMPLYDQLAQYLEIINFFTPINMASEKPYPRLMLPSRQLLLYRVPQIRVF